MHALIPVTIPASVYGMVLMFVALILKVVKLEWVSDAGHFLVSIMPVMFVCPAVGLLKCLNLVKEHWVAICVITVVSLVLTFVVTGWVT